MGEAVYRFYGEESLYFGMRYGKVTGEFLAGEPDVSIRRVQLNGGWFLIPQILVKGEYVHQKYSDFPVSDIRHDGKFSGVVLEGVVAF